jgi:hypothetical protein
MMFSGKVFAIVGAFFVLQAVRSLFIPLDVDLCIAEKSRH